MAVESGPVAPSAQGGTLERLFKFKANGTSLRTDTLAGLTTFMVMAYIIFLNPIILSFAGNKALESKGLPFAAVLTSTCLVAGVMTLIMGLYTNRAYALAPGLGINAVVAFAAAEGTAHATARQITQAVEELAEMSPAQLRKRFDPQRAEIICAGAIILESLVHHLGLETVTAVQRGLRDGILVDLVRRIDSPADDHSLAEAALLIGRRFQFDEAHSAQVTRLALQLFDDLAPLHRLPASSRPLRSQIFPPCRSSALLRPRARSR